MTRLKQSLLLTVQITALVAICAVGQFVVRTLHLPIPGFLLGMVFLFALLASGALPVHWIEEGASLLLRHLSFFFIPIAVGLMAFGPLFRVHGATIIITLLTSAVVGILGTALVAQALSHKDKQQ